MTSEIWGAGQTELFGDHPGIVPCCSVVPPYTVHVPLQYLPSLSTNLKEMEIVLCKGEKSIR
jgi:hypothetical protein